MNESLAANSDTNIESDQTESIEKNIQPNDTPSSDSEVKAINEWKISEELVGNGDVPEWFNSKTFGTVFEQAKAYPHLRKKLGEFVGSPDEYSLDFGKDYEDKTANLDRENGFLPDFIKLAKEGNMSQNLFSEIVKSYVNFDCEQNKLVAESLENKKSLEKQKIKDKIGDTENPDKAISELCLWYKNNFGTEDYENFVARMCTAEDFFRWRNVKDKFTKKVPSSSQQNSKTFASHDDRIKALTDPRYLSDEKFKKIVDQMYAQSMGVDLE